MTSTDGNDTSDSLRSSNHQLRTKPESLVVLSTIHICDYSKSAVYIMFLRLQQSGHGGHNLQKRSTLLHYKSPLTHVGGMKDTLCVPLAGPNKRVKVQTPGVLEQGHSSATIEKQLPTCFQALGERVCLNVRHKVTWQPELLIMTQVLSDAPNHQVRQAQHTYHKTKVIHLESGMVPLNSHLWAHEKVSTTNSAGEFYVLT